MTAPIGRGVPEQFGQAWGIDVINPCEKDGPGCAIRNGLRWNEGTFAEPNALDGDLAGRHDQGSQAGRGREYAGIAELVLVRWRDKPSEPLHQDEGVKDEFRLSGACGAS